MNWKKRTPLQVEESVNKRDYTGGYEFGPWLIHMRKWYLVGFFGNFGGGIGCLSAYFDGRDPVALGASIFFGILAPTLIGYMLRRDFKKLKVGQSS